MPVGGCSHDTLVMVTQDVVFFAEVQHVFVKLKSQETRVNLTRSSVMNPSLYGSVRCLVERRRVTKNR